MLVFKTAFFQAGISKARNLNLVGKTLLKVKVLASKKGEAVCCLLPKKVLLGVSLSHSGQNGNP